MGIPRLTQDLTPYLETVVIGESQLNSCPLVIQKLVIDGPSLVYHVYNAILPSMKTSGSIDRLPSYALINACFFQFLDDLCTRGAQVCAILFDGALPLSKRLTRRDRLEKTRQNLDNYRKTFASNAINPDSNSSKILSVTDVVEPSELQRILWSGSAPKSTRLRLLPPPPFMVPSVIESLMTSKWASITQVVPGEADEYCAIEAVRTGAAIVSNDSDLLLYELGANGVVLMLRTIQLVSYTDGDTCDTLVGQCLRPAEIANQLQIQNVLTFAFHRSQDSSLSTIVITQRARQEVSSIHKASWINFQKAYSISESSLRYRSPESKHIKQITPGTDPRTSELIFSCAKLETLHMYLPVVLEDPTRDSCWSYSIGLRQLAYSILLQSHKANNKMTTINQVAEHARGGSTIAEYKVQKLSKPETIEQVKAIVSMLKQYQTSRSMDKDIVKTNSKLPRYGDDCLTTDERMFLGYYLLASEIVIAQRVSKAKTYQPSLSNLFPLNSLKSSSAAHLTWDDLHMHATIQSVLYSIRILKQIAEFCVHESTISPETDLQSAAQDLCTHLVDMPTIADIFLDASSLRCRLECYPSDHVASNVAEMVQRVDPATCRSTQSHNLPQVQLERNKHSKVLENVAWQNIKPSNRKRSNRKRRIGRLSDSSSSRDLRPRHSSTRQQHGGNANSFALLQEHEGSSDGDE